MAGKIRLTLDTRNLKREHSSSTIVQRLWNYCNVSRDERRLSVVRDVPYGDDIESAVEAGLARAARLRHIVPAGEAVSRSAFEKRL